MKEINIAKVIISKRKEKGITQEGLARFVGVSKASVSKWETEQSYPDIVLLPQLAAYFDISLDELMGYEPQMSGESISRLCKELAYEFAEKPFEDVMYRCRSLVKKYYSCFPLLYRIAALYVNNSVTLEDDAQRVSTVREAKELFIRVKTQSSDTVLKQLALHFEAMCEMMLGNPEAIIVLLADVKPPPPHDVLLSQAYMMTGKGEEAKAILHKRFFIGILELFETIPPYLTVCAGDTEHFEEICRRTMALIKTFNLHALAPTSIMPFYLAAAQGCLANGNGDKSLDILETYTDLVTGNLYPLRILKGDDFFHLIDSLAEELPFGLAELPRDEKLIRQSMADAVVGNPAFSALSGDPRFKRLSGRLIHNMR